MTDSDQVGDTSKNKREQEHRYRGPLTSRWAVVLVALLLMMLFAGLAVLMFPFWGVPHLWRLQTYIAPKSPADKAALVQAEVQASAVFVQFLGGLILLFTVVAALMTVRQTQKSLELNREQLRVAQDGQITDRFTMAIEQLGATDARGQSRIEIRLGGIYALERIASDSCRGAGDTPDWCRDHWPIMEVLTAYVRDNAPATSNAFDPSKDYRLRTDIQAILTMIGRRKEVQRIAEKKLNVRLNLSEAQLQGVSLVRAQLQGADFRGAQLHKADFFEAHLQKASFYGAQLQGAGLRRAQLQGASFYEAELQGADLYEAQLQGADLTGVTGLSQAQIDTTCMDEGTILPNAPGPDGQPYRRSNRVCR